MDNAARARQRILALFLPLTAVLYIGAEGLTPKGLDQVVQTRATAFEVLPIAAAHPAQLYVAGSLALLALGALAVSYAAIAALVRDRGSAMATVAALMGGIGAFCGALVNVLVYPSLAAVATAHLSQDAAARFLVTAFNSGFGHAFLYAYFIGIFAAPVLMGLPCGAAGAYRAGWRYCSSSAWKSPSRCNPKASSSSWRTPCHLRWRWSCWPPGSGRRLPCRPATTRSRASYLYSRIYRLPQPGPEGTLHEGLSSARGGQRRRQDTPRRG